MALFFGYRFLHVFRVRNLKFVAIPALAMLAACSSADDELQRPGRALETGLNRPQITTLAAFRSVCLGTSLDQQGAERALFVLGYKAAGEDPSKGVKRFAKGEARVALSYDPAAAPGSTRRSSCVASHSDLGSREAKAIMEQAIRSSGLSYRPRGDGAASVEGSDYSGVVRDFGNLGESGLAIIKTARPAQ